MEMPAVPTTGTPVTDQVAESVGRFRYDVASHAMWWSEAMYLMHGLAPGEVVPTSELVLVHEHGEDRDRVSRVIQEVLARAETFCCRHRIIDTAGKTHVVVALGEGVLDDAGRVAQVRGYLIDVSEAVRHDVEAASREAVQRSAGARAVIEQAKGALMVTYGLDEDEAFTILCWHSQHNNVKLRELAGHLVERFAAPEVAALTPRETIGDFLASLPDVPGRHAIRTAPEQ